MNLSIYCDYNCANLVRALKKQKELSFVGIESDFVPKTVIDLISADLEFVHQAPSCIFISFQIDSIVKTEACPEHEINDQIQNFAKLVSNLSNKAKAVFVTTFIDDPEINSFSLLSLKKGGRSRLLYNVNANLINYLSDKSNIVIIDQGKLVSKIGSTAFSPKLWYMSKIPYSDCYFNQLANHIKNSLSGILGQTRKVVVLDLDDTLWGGIIGDDTIKNIRLGGHDAVGEAFADVQRFFKKVKDKGVLLAICSKNNLEVALYAINNHPEMILRENDFVSLKINWEDKAQNVLELSKELNLGLSSFVFIDDNPFERNRIRDILPEVLVPELPNDKLLVPRFISSLECFNSSAITQEDLQRSTEYQNNIKRESYKRSFSNLDDWLESLQLKIEFNELSVHDQARCVQLLNKTNQMNSNPRRITEDEFIKWLNLNQANAYSVRVSDKFGDYGLTGLFTIQILGDVCQVFDWVISCRVMSRRVEHEIVNFILNLAKKSSANIVQIKYQITDKNMPMIQIFDSFGWTKTSEVYSFGVDYRHGKERIALICGNND